MSRSFLPIAILALGSIALSSCNVDKRALGVVDIEVVAGQKLLDPSVASFVVEGGSSDVRLLNVSSPSAVVTRMVDANKKDISMDKGVTIPAGGKVRFGPGEAQMVLMDRVNRIPRGTNEIEIIFVFSNGDRQFATAPYDIPDGAEEL